MVEFKQLNYIMKKPFSITLVLIIIFLILTFSIKDSLAKVDLSLKVSDITFSKEDPLEGDKIRIFARIFNVGDVDVYGFVVFLINDEIITDPQPISIKASTYDDVFIDWQIKEGIYDVQAKIIGTNFQDESPIDNVATRENISLT